MNKLTILRNGIIKENPVLVLALGLCPALAVSTRAMDAVGIGIATTFVLIGSNFVISALRTTIPNKVRIPCYMVLIAGFTTIVQMLLRTYVLTLYEALGIFLPLITINCIIFGRAEIFARKNTVINSLVDAIGVGAGFTLAMFAMGATREILGSGTLFEFAVPMFSRFHIPVFVLAPGGFVVLGLLIALVNKVSDGKAIKKKEFGCDNCHSSGVCGKRFGGAK